MILMYTWVCELVGICLQSELNEVMEKPSYGLYRDDGLGIFRRLGKPDIERRKKRIIQIFKRHGLDITIKANLKIAQYLDVELDLMNNLYRPYRKPNSEPLYINTQSNHPPSVLKQISKSVQGRLSDISSNADVFNQASRDYKNALQNSGHQNELNHQPITGQIDHLERENQKQR